MSLRNKGMSADIERFLKHNTGLRESTRDHYRRDLQQFARWLSKNNRDIHDKEVFYDWLDLYPNPASKLNWAILLNQFRVFLEMKRLKFKRPHIPQHVWNDQAIIACYEKMLPCLGDRNRAILVLIRWAGVRAMEALTLKTDNISFEHGILHVHVRISKTRVRLIPVPDATAEIRAYMDRQAKRLFPGRWLFPTRKGTHADYDDIERIVSRLSRKCGHYFTLHDLRRVRETEFGSRYGGRILMDYFGQKSLDIVELYINRARGSAKDAIYADLGIVKNSPLFTERRCWRCNSQNQPGAIHCSTCGEILDQSAIPNREIIDKLDEDGLESLLLRILKKRGILH